MEEKMDLKFKYHRFMVQQILMNVKLVRIMSARCKAETSRIKLKQKRAPPSCNWDLLGVTLML